MRLSTFGLVCAVAVGLPSAPAGAIEGCTGGMDPEVTVAGCTAALRSGALSGGDVASAYANRCGAQFALSRYELALQDCNEAIRRAPRLTRAFLFRALTRSRMGDLSEAIHDYDVALEIDPGDAFALSLRGEAKLRLGRYNDALRDLDAALRLNPDLTLGHYNRGIVHTEMGDYDRAYADFAAVIRLDPKNGAPYGALARSLYLAGREVEAVAFVEVALQHLPNDASVINTRAHILAALGQVEVALANFERAMTVGGPDRVLMYQLALAGHGYFPGPADGIYGPITRDALRACLQAGCRLMD